jgi:hypothetical protein
MRKATDTETRLQRDIGVIAKMHSAMSKTSKRSREIRESHVTRRFGSFNRGLMAINDDGGRNSTALHRSLAQAIIVAITPRRMSGDRQGNGSSLQTGDRKFLTAERVSLSLRASVEALVSRGFSRCALARANPFARGARVPRISRARSRSRASAF